MSQWSNENPGAGSSAGSSSSITALSKKGSTLDDVYTHSLAAVSAANRDAWSGSAGTAWRMKARGVVRVLPELKEGYSAALSAIAHYQSTVESIRSRAEPMRSELEHARSTFWHFDGFRAPWDLEGIAEDAAGKVRNLQTQWDASHGLAALGRERQAADEHLVGILNSLVDLSADNDVATRLGSGTHNTTDLITDASLATLSDAELLALLGGLTATELAAILNDHPAIAERIARQSPATIREWWADYYTQRPSGDPTKLTPEQQAIVDAIPLVIGNLDGIPYTHRDIANIEAHEERLETLMDLRAGALRALEEGGMPLYDKYLADHGFPGDALSKAITGEQAIDKALAAHGDVTYQFVQYKPGPPLLAAISVGNMDTASQVTVNVPGMGTTVDSSMESWTAGARNLYEEQRALNAMYGHETGLAVVSWIGYDTPLDAVSHASDQVIHSDKAEVGAANLKDFLTGITGTREWDAGQNLSVVGHSYGTTVATLAVHDTPVESLTLLASAGVDNSITNVSQLQVDPDHFWASEAKGDWVADIGRGDVPVTYPFGFQGHLYDNPAFEHHVDPKLPGFGGNVFSSESSGSLHGSNDHDALSQTEAQIKHKKESEYGYLDAGTTPLHNTGVSSLGLDPSLMAKP